MNDPTKIIIHPARQLNDELIAHFSEIIEKAEKGEIYLLLEGCATNEPRTHKWHFDPDIEIEPTKYFQGIDSRFILTLSWLCDCIDKAYHVIHRNSNDITAYYCVISWLNVVMCREDFLAYIKCLRRQDDWYIELQEIIDVLSDNLEPKYGQSHRISDILDENDIDVPVSLPVIKYIHITCKEYLRSKIHFDLDYAMMSCSIATREQEMANNVNKWINSPGISENAPIHMFIGLNRLFPGIDPDIIKGMMSPEEADAFINYHSKIAIPRFLTHLQVPWEIHDCLGNCNNELNN